MSEVITPEVIAEPSDELRITHATPGSAIESNITSVKAWVDAQLATYAVPTIETDEEYKQAKRDRTSLRKIGASVDAERKRVKGIYEAPLKAFEDEVRTITDPVKALDAAMKGAISGYEDGLKAKRRQTLEHFYSDYAPLLVPNVPYERLHEDAWLNQSTDLQKALDALQDKVDNIAATYEQLCDMDIAHPTEAKAAYFATLDIMAAITCDRNLTEQERAVEEMEAERQALLSEEAARQPVEDDKPIGKIKLGTKMVEVYDAGPDPEARGTYTITFEDITKAQYQSIITFCREQGIHGKAAQR